MPCQHLAATYWQPNNLQYLNTLESIYRQHTNHQAMPYQTFYNTLAKTFYR